MAPYDESDENRLLDKLQDGISRYRQIPWRCQSWRLETYQLHTQLETALSLTIHRPGTVDDGRRVRCVLTVDDLQRLSNQARAQLARRKRDGKRR